MMKAACIALLAFAMLSMVAAESAHLIVQKKIDTDPVVKGENITVQYTVFNAGDRCVVTIGWHSSGRRCV